MVWLAKGKGLALRIGVSALVGWIIASGFYAAGLLLGYEPSPRLVVGVAVGITLVLALAADRIALLLARQVGRVVLDIDEIEVLYEEEEYDPDPEAGFLAGVFVNEAVRRLLPGARAILQDNTGAPIYDPDLRLLEAVRALNPRSIQGMGSVKAVHYYNNILGIILEPESYNALASAVRRGGGERVVVWKPDEIVTLYQILKTAYLARYPEAGDEIAGYMAYKAILRLIRDGILEATPRILDYIPYEQEETRKKILKQIQEEEII